MLLPIDAQVEALISLATLKTALPLSELDPSAFACPAGWSEEQDETSRRRKKKWVQYDAGGSYIREFERRQELETALEDEAAAGGGAPWLGQLVPGVEGTEWQISPGAMTMALTHILDGLVTRGLASFVPANEVGATRVQPHWAVSNAYYKAEPFPKPKREKEAKDDDDEEEEDEEDLADIEIERKKNIARNQEILRQLGLA